MLVTIYTINVALKTTKLLLSDISSCCFFPVNMENYCDDSISMIMSDFEQGKITLNTDGYAGNHNWDITGQSNSCEMVLESW